MEILKVHNLSKVYGGVANTPWRATAAAQLLVGAAPGAGLFAQAAVAALAAVT